LFKKMSVSPDASAAVATRDEAQVRLVANDGQSRVVRRGIGEHGGGLVSRGVVDHDDLTVETAGQRYLQLGEAHPREAHLIMHGYDDRRARYRGVHRPRSKPSHVEAPRLRPVSITRCVTPLHDADRPRGDPARLS
jgi:hypothetical protein